MARIALFGIIYILKKKNTCWYNFTNFPVIKNTIKRIAFENGYESSIIFQPLLYANVPSESPSYAPTFFGTEHPLVKGIQICSNEEPFNDNGVFLFLINTMVIACVY